jgi:hypothetical protein
MTDTKMKGIGPGHPDVAKKQKINPLIPLEEQTMPLDELVTGDDEVLTRDPTPGVLGEAAGSARGPDGLDTLEQSHQVGLRMDEDIEHPQELDIAGDVEAAENTHKNNE